jgi:hypothetical protein
MMLYNKDIALRVLNREDTPTEVNRMFIVLIPKLQEFKPTQGIRQGDPISPYLFLLCAEGLSNVFKGNGVEGRVQGIQVSSSAPIINHLLFADDSTLFFKATPSNAKAVHDSISMYCEASCQKVNTSKSSIFFRKGCRQNVQNEIKSITQIDNESINKNTWACLLVLANRLIELLNTLKIEFGTKLKDG